MAVAMLELPLRIAGALAFRLIDHLPSSRQRDMYNRLHRQLRDELARKLFAKGNTVRSGHFAGLIVPHEIVANPNFQLGQIVGSFEVVVHDIIARHAGRHKRFIDIGCGLGYYTVGVAKKFGLPSFGYDTNSEQIELASVFAKANAVDQIVTHEVVEISRSYDDLSDSLVLIDIDGGEVDLMPKVLTWGGSTASFVIECHATKYGPPLKTAEAIAETMRGTHASTIYSESHLVDLDAAEVCGISRNDYLMLARERRKEYPRWLLLTPIDQAIS